MRGYKIKGRVTVAKVQKISSTSNLANYPKLCRDLKMHTRRDSEGWIAVYNAAVDREMVKLLSTTYNSGRKSH